MLEEPVLGVQNAEKHVFCFIRDFRRSFCEVFVKMHKELAVLILHHSSPFPT